jgi:hypothetical protein
MLAVRPPALQSKTEAKRKQRKIGRASVRKAGKMRERNFVKPNIEWASVRKVCKMRERGCVSQTSSVRACKMQKRGCIKPND